MGIRGKDWMQAYTLNDAQAVERRVQGIEQSPCGCPTMPGRYAFRCYRHVTPRMRTDDTWQRGDWYRANTCYFCGRATPQGLACDRTESCEACGIVSCDRHDMAAYKLGVTCPKLVNPRTKVGKALLKAFKAWPAWRDLVATA